MALDTLESWLRRYVSTQGAISGTVHLRVDDELRLVAAINVPAHDERAAARLPRGQGIAGQAWQRHRPVATCCLQAAPRQGSESRAAAAVALPIEDGQGTVRAVVGIGYADARVFPEHELHRLRDAAQELPHA